MRIGIPLIVILVLLTLPQVLALPTDIASTCNGDNLTYSIDSIRCVNSNCVPIQRNSTILCQYGCNSGTVPNECNPAPFQVNLLFLGAIFVMLIIAGVIIARR